MKNYNSKKWICAMLSILGVFILQVTGTPLDPLVAGSLFTFLTGYVIGQSWIDTKKEER